MEVPSSVAGVVESVGVTRGRPSLRRQRAAHGARRNAGRRSATVHAPHRSRPRPHRSRPRPHRSRRHQTVPLKRSTSSYPTSATSKTSRSSKCSSNPDKQSPRRRRCSSSRARRRRWKCRRRPPERSPRSKSNPATRSRKEPSLRRSGPAASVAARPRKRHHRRQNRRTHAVCGARSEGVVHASPAIRRFARELGVDLQGLRGSGPRGRVTREDVQGFVKSALRAGRRTPARRRLAGLPPWPKVDFAQLRRRSNAHRSRASKGFPARTCIATGCRFRTSPTTTRRRYRSRSIPQPSQRASKANAAAPNSRCWRF